VSSIGRDCTAHTAGETCPVRAAHPHASHTPRDPNQHSTPARYTGARSPRPDRPRTLHQRCTLSLRRTSRPRHAPAPAIRATPAAASASPAPGAANPRRASRRKPPPHLFAIIAVTEACHAITRPREHCSPVRVDSPTASASMAGSGKNAKVVTQPSTPLRRRSRNAIAIAFRGGP
jgi:hypothetical protein